VGLGRPYPREKEEREQGAVQNCPCDTSPLCGPVDQPQTEAGHSNQLASARQEETISKITQPSPAGFSIGLDNGSYVSSHNQNITKSKESTANISTHNRFAVLPDFSDIPQLDGFLSDTEESSDTEEGEEEEGELRGRGGFL
jgi:hypothetical protein